MKIGIVITLHNRAEYTRQCFKSLRQLEYPSGTVFCLMDDCSTEIEATEAMYSFYIPDCPTMKNFSPKQKGVAANLIDGIEQLFAVGCDLIINIDNDAIVNKTFLKVLLGLHKKFPDSIVTGFNSLNKNSDGSERHPIIERGKGYLKKTSVGGINMCFGKSEYDKYLKVAMQNAAKGGDNWDRQACIAAMKDNRPIICSDPSVVQHISAFSAMGHTDEPDRADDFWLHSLPDVTLIGATSSDIKGLVHAADISAKYIRFGEVKLLSSIFGSITLITKLPNESDVVIRPLASKAEYNQFVLKELANYFSTSHCLIIQSDGYVVNPYAWRDEYLAWDYIGAVWNFNHQPYAGYHVGNGGFSLRSLRLHQILRDDPLIKPTNDQYIKNFEEDHNICKIYRPYLERKYAIKYAPREIADQFSVELYGVPPPGNRYNGSFGFHGTSVDFTGCDLEHIPYSHPSRIFNSQ